jgi:hypothetical protein
VPVARTARWLADGWDALDRVLGVVIAPIVQNYRFVARKAGDGSGVERS